MKIRDAAFWKAYREKRKHEKNPVPNGISDKAYREKRASEGRPVPKSSHHKWKRKHFLAWDGEGVSDPAPGPESPAPHRYIMLANSAGEVLESDRIRTSEAFDFLLAGAAKHPKAVHIMYGGNYDAVKIMEDIPREKIAAIYKNQTDVPTHVVLDGRTYAVWYRARKQLKIHRFAPGRRFSRDEKTGKWKPRYDASIVIWDVLGFFQSRFVDALKEYGIAFDAPEMEAMKKKRAEFTDDERERIRAYCVSECNALVDLTSKLAQHLHEAGLWPARWDGAGAVAASLLRREGIKEYKEAEPDRLALPVATAFFGGRIELLQLGRVGAPVYGYDIASAYPAAAHGLPSLLGTWRKVKKLDGFCLARVTWEFPEGARWYPLPYRNPRGSIVFPSTGAGWYWRPEVEAAQAFAARFGGRVEVEEIHRMCSVADAQPFAFVEALFRERQKRKQNKEGVEKAMKLGLNSLYGKTAQQIGAREGEWPPYFSLSWAGWITSGTRARLVHAALHYPEAVIAFATDGIYTTRELPLTPLYAPKSPDIALGAWEGPEVANDGVFVQAGVYWLLVGERWKARYRGFDREGMETPDTVLARWSSGDGAVMVPATRFVTWGGALGTPKTKPEVAARLWSWRGTWKTIPRTLDLRGKSPKRIPWNGRGKPWERMVPLAPAINEVYEATGEPSKPYDSITLEKDVVDGMDRKEFEREVEESYV